MLVGVLAAGCATVTNESPDSWRVEPLFRLSHGDGDKGNGLLALGRAYEGERRWRDAEDVYRRSASRAPGDPQGHNALGRVLAAQQRHAEAVTAFRRAVALQPAQAQWLNNLGYALMLVGEHDEASRVLQQALSLEPGYALARANLAVAERKLARHHATPSPVAAERLAPMAQGQELSPALQLRTAPNLPPLPVHTGDGPVMARAEETKALPQPTPVEPAAPQREKPDARLEIANGNGVTGAAARLAGQLRQQGYQRGRLTNLKPYTTSRTLVEYRQGYEAQAQDIARELPVTPVIAHAQGLRPGTDVRVVIGHDAIAHDRAYLARKRDTPGSDTL